MLKLSFALDNARNKSNEMKVKKGVKKGTGYFFCKKEDSLYSWTVHQKK